MINEILSALLQVVAFSMIPFSVYLAKTKKVRGFFVYIGLKRSTAKANLLAALASAIFLVPPLALYFLSDDFRQIMTDPTTMTGKFRAMGLRAETVVILLVAAVFKTSLSEEILFRGFITKRLMAIMGYRWGNVTQAVLFGAVHVTLFMAITTDIFFLTFILFFAASGAYLSAYLNERMANGSIIPGWISHGIANTVSYAAVSF